MSKVAVLLATYNGEKYITELLVSLFRQTVDFTLYVHDDGSTDGTLEIVDAFAKANPGRVVVLSGPRCGSAKANFLWMLGEVEADYYFLCDQDDVWMEGKMNQGSTPQSLRDSSPSLKGSQDSDPSLKGSLVYSDMFVVDKELNEISDSFIRYIGRDPYRHRYTQVLIDNPAAGCTMCLDRRLRDIVVEAARQVDLDNIPMHDAFILVLADIFGSVTVIDEPLVYYRQTGENTMGAETESGGEKVMRNVDMLKRGGFLDRKKAFVLEARLFAGEILKVDGLPEDVKLVLTEFVSIGEKSKLARMRFYKKNGFTRAHHDFWMRLWV